MCVCVCVCVYKAKPCSSFVSFALIIFNLKPHSKIVYKSRK